MAPSRGEAVPSFVTTRVDVASESGPTGRSRVDAAKRLRNVATRTRTVVSDPQHLPVMVLLGLFVGWNFYLGWRLYYGYGYPPFDLAIFDQGLWLLTHFHAPFVTVMGRNLFGDHTSFILLLVAPLYRLVPEPQGLLVLQTLMIAGAAIPIYVLARRLISSTWIPTLLVAVYLLNPALQQGNMEQFHPEAFQVLIISIAIYAAYESRGVLLGVMVVLALLVKEDAAVLIVPLGAWVMWRRDKTWGLRIIGAAIIWGVIANLMIIPAILGTNNFYASRIPFGGFTGFVATLIRRPAQMWSYLRSDARGYYVWQTGFSMGWAFLLAPEVAAIALLVVAENVFSNDPYMHQIIYHYSLPIVPVLMLGTVVAIAAQKSQRRRNVVTGVVVASAMWSCVLWGLAPFSNGGVVPTWSPNSAVTKTASAIERSIPPNAVVAAWYPLVAHLDHRTQIYVWPNPFSAANYGLGTDTGSRLAAASQVRYLVLPVPLTDPNDIATFATIQSSFHVVESANGLALYEKNSG